MFKFGSKNDINTGFKCTIRLLDDSDVLECQFHVCDKGSNLLDHICEQLNLVEKDYFGLRYVDSSRQRHWLDLSKTVLKQIKDMDPILFNFRIKFYPPDPFKLKENLTRYHLYLQLKRDLAHGRLYCTPYESSHLAALIIQAELGDYDPDEHTNNYISSLKLLLKQTQQIEEKIMELHQEEMKGQDATTAENNFLRRAVSLDTYGVDPHPVKDHKGNQLYLGINYQGILTFQGIYKLHHFKWPEVHKLKFEGKMFIIHLIYREDARSKKKHTVGFKCPTVGACRHVWRCAIEQMLFFTLPSSSSVPSVISGGSIFSFGTKFRYSGRVEKEVLEDSGRDEQPSIVRSSSLRIKANSVPDTPLTPSNSDLCKNYALTQCSPGLPDSSIYGGQEFSAHDSMDNASTIGVSHLRGGLSDYYFPPDALGHSYSESHLMKVSQRSGRLTKPVPFPPSSVKIPLSSASSPPAHSHQPTSPPPPPPTTSNTKFHFMKVFWPSFIAAAIVVVVVIVLLLETETEAFSAIRQMPEMVTLRVHYYEHVKQYLKLQSPS